jgi:hypothetical protein
VRARLDARAEDGELTRVPRARSRVATPETAAVRIPVIAEALTTARTSPVSPSERMTTPW